MAKKNRAAASTSRVKLFYILLGLVAVVGIGSLLYAVLGGRAGGAAVEPVAVAGTEDPRVLIQKAQGVSVGPKDAPVQVVVFSDFMCPYCGQFTLQVERLLKENYAQTGKIHYVYYDFPLGGAHRHSFLAARAARCAGDQGKFWEYHDYLFGQQSEWSYERNPPVGQFEDYAEALGLDRAAFSECLRSDRHADVVSANRLLGEQLGVNATPTVFVNGRRVERPLDWPAFKALIEGEAGAGA